MKGYIRAKINYCAFMGKNVVFACKQEYDFECWECLNRVECDYDLLGCRNSLSQKTESELLTNSGESAIISK